MSDKQLFAVVGYPILHSLSPQIFNYLFKIFNLNYSYSRISALSSAELFSLINNIGINGINVTSPFKNEIKNIFNLNKSINDHFYPVNTLIFSESVIEHYNTDGFGVISTLKSHLKDLKNKSCLIIGAGGAGVGIIPDLKKEDLNLFLTNRTSEKAKQIANHFEINFIETGDLNNSLNKFDIIINTCNHFDENIDFKLLKSNCLFLDSIYHKSNLSHFFKDSDIIYVSGKEWLYYQALKAFELFFKLDCSTKHDLFNIKELEIKFKNIIILVGFSGSGKSTLAKALANKIGFKYIDIDSMIEDNEKMTIPEIFKSKGEKYFRLKEYEFLLSFQNQEKCVIATGGGIVTNPMNNELMKNIGIVIWLHSSLDTCLKRIDILSRPMLTERTEYKNIENLYKERQEKYFEISDLIINSEKDINLIVEQIDFEYNNLME
jgi:shikimate dehydrogenase